ncbi:MAG: PEGA domain-containing protein [Polyangiales bacterium]
MVAPPRSASSHALALALAGIVGISAVVVVRAPFADTATTKGSGTLADAKVHMDKGQEYFLTKEFAKAATEFHTAYEIKPFSSFLYNEAVCQEKLGQLDVAIGLFQKYVDTDTTAPDRTKVIEKIEALKKRNETALDAGVGDGGEAGVSDAAVPTVGPVVATIDEMRSIVVIESLPEGAPVEIWSKTDPAAAKFVIGGENKGWTKVVTGVTTLQQSLPLGTYHVVIPKFQDYRATDTDVTVAAATISQFKANLAQGSFFGVFKIRSYAEGAEVRGAHVFVRKDNAKYLDRGVTPYEESLESGTYFVRVEQPGFVPLEKKIELEHDKIDEQKFELQRSDDGLIRVDAVGADSAEVIIDDRSVGLITPGIAVNAPVKAGSHRVKIKADDRKTYTTDVDVQKGKMVVVHTELKPTVPRGGAWTSAIASAVFIGGGIYLGIVSNNLKAELNDARANGRLDQEDTRIKKGTFYAIGADVCFGVGAIFAVIATYNFLKDPLPNSAGRSEPSRDLDPLPAAPRPVAKLMPYGGPNLAGLAIVGEF